MAPTDPRLSPPAAASRATHGRLGAFALSLMLAACSSEVVFEGESGGGHHHDHVTSLHEIVVLADGQRNPHAIALNQERVFWTEGTSPGSVATVAKAGGQWTKLVESKSPGEIAVDESRVYWLSTSAPGALLSMPVEGGAPMVLATTDGFADAFAMDEAYVYWSQVKDAEGVDIGRIMRTPKEGGETVVLAQTAEAYAMAADAVSIYWMAIGGALEGIKKLPKDGGAEPALVVNDIGSGHRIVVDAESVYYGIGEGLAKVAKGGGEAVVLRQGGTPFGMAVDEEHVYWATNYEGVLRLPKAGGSAEVIATGSFHAAAVAVDATHVYWTTFEGESQEPGSLDGAILRMEK